MTLSRPFYTLRTRTDFRQLIHILAAMSAQTILYDLPTKQNTAWSLNPWKSKCGCVGRRRMLTTTARLILNFKGVDYKTEWVEFPDVEPKMKAL